MMLFDLSNPFSIHEVHVSYIETIRHIYYSLF